MGANQITRQIGAVWLRVPRPLRAALDDLPKQADVEDFIPPFRRCKDSLPCRKQVGRRYE